MGVLVMLTAMTTLNTCRKKAGEIMSMYRQEKKAKNRTVKNVYTVEQKRRNGASEGNGNSLRRKRQSSLTLWHRKQGRMEERVSSGH